MTTLNNGSIAVFINLMLLKCCTREFFIMNDFSAHCRMVSSITGLNSLNANSKALVAPIKNVPRYCLCPLETKLPLIENSFSTR